MTAIRNLLLVLGNLSFIIVIGGATYEHLAVVPVWSSAVPASLSMFQGEYALAAQAFWIPIHPVTLALLSLAMILNWRTKRRNYILTAIGGYLSILVATFIYFVPELIALTGSQYSTVVDYELTRRAGRWEFLSLIRLGALILLAIVLLLGLTRSSEPQSNTL
jgi:hypothetical protein